MVEIAVEAEVRPTEDVEKVKKALSTVVNASEFVIEEIAAGFKVIRTKCDRIECMEPLRNTIKIQQIEPAVRAYLYKYKSKGVLTVMLHKQVAYVGKISLVDDARESPLGPIKVEVSGTEEEIEELIDYLTGK
ncbi:MAG: RNA-binding domain-containing protein [Desulfurococcaceae archaeon]